MTAGDDDSIRLYRTDSGVPVETNFSKKWGWACVWCGVVWWVGLVCPPHGRWLAIDTLGPVLRRARAQGSGTTLPLLVAAKVQPPSS